VSFSLPAPKWLLEIGAIFMRTETELILKSRRVVPARLLESGFAFRFPTWRDAAADLCRQTHGPAGFRSPDAPANSNNSAGEVPAVHSTAPRSRNSVTVLL
jgi:hypothetical protein